MERRVAVVTGGSRGLGRAISLELARSGAFVVINYRSGESQARETLERLRAEGGQGALARADVADGAAVREMFHQVQREHGRVDILVNNAGITRDEYLLVMRPESWRDVLRTNLHGVYHCSRAVVRGMCAARHGVIVNIGSGSSVSPRVGQVNYGATKSGLIGFTKALARELAPRGVRVVGVAPGFIHTEMSHAVSPRVLEESLRRIPMRRWGEPEEVARIVGFLSSEEASFLTGQMLLVDGGRMADENDFGTLSA